MRIHRTSLGRGVLFAASLLALSGMRTSAQTADAQSNAGQKNRIPARVTDIVDDTNRVVLRGNVHPKARAEFDRGAVSDAQPITRLLLLLQRSPEQEAALRQLMEQQQTKNSPNYHAWLTPEQFGTQFGPADADVQAVTDWLTSHGFQNIKVSKGRVAVEFSGNVGQVRKAFSTEIHQFNVNGKEHFANVSDPQIPVALAPVVKGLRSLHNFRAKPQLRTLGSFRRTEAGEILPLFTYTDANGQFFGVGPADFAMIYNVPATIAGSPAGLGQTIAIVGRSNINIQDVRDFRSMFGLPANDPNIILNGPDPGLIDGDETEADLDVEWAGAVAPAATIDFVVTESAQTDGTDGVDGSALFIVENNIAPILSESFGACEPGLGSGGNAFFNALWQQAAAEGITVVVAAGDNGSAACDPAAAPANQDAATQGVAISGIASTPFNTAMGGTDFDDAGNQQKFWNTANTTTATPPAIPASALGYIPETTWNDTCAAAGSTTGCTAAIVNGNASSGVDLVAGSGGPSTVYTGPLKPSWQTGFGDTARDIPDVSLFSADGKNKSFYIICQSDQDPAGGAGCNLTTSASSKTHDFLAVGGTSAATPTFAAIMALVIQQQLGQRQGLANPALYNTYSIAKAAGNVCSSSSFTSPSTSNACVFYDVVKGNDSVACVGGTANCSNKTAGQFGILATAAGGTTPAFGTAMGYDLATGLGTLNVANLVKTWKVPSRTTPTITLNFSPTPATVGVSVTASGAVTPTTATGLVVLENSVTHEMIQPSCLTTSPLCTANSLSGGSYNFPTTFLPGGSYSVLAHYGGDGTFAPADSAPTPVTVAKQNSQTVVNFITATGAFSTAAQSVAYGSPYILRIDVENATGQMCQNLNGTSFHPPLSFVCPTGTITLTDNGSASVDFPNGQASLNDRGFAEDQPIQLLPGVHKLAASYPGDASYNASNSNTLAVTITQAATSVTVTPSASSVAAGGSVTLTALVSTNSNGAGATGTVQFKNGSSNLGTAVSCAAAAASATAAASCTATLTTALSQLVPLNRPQPRIHMPALPLWVTALLALLILALAQRAAASKGKFPTPAPSRGLGFAAAALLLFACIAAGFAGCGGSKISNSTGSGGTSHTDSITAVYSGDANYAGSTSAAVTVTVQ
jgi:hypothetical protein